MSGLLIHTRPDRLDGARAPSGTTTAAISAQLLDELLEEAGARAGRTARIGAIGEGLLFFLTVIEASGPLAGIEAMPKMRRCLLNIFQAATAFGLSPPLLQRLFLRLSHRVPEAQQRLGEIGRLYGRYRALCGGRFVDDAGAFRRAVQALADQPPPQAAGGVEVHDLWCAKEGGVLSRQGRLLALLALGTGEPEPGTLREGAARRSIPVRIVLPAVEGRPLLEAGLSPLLEELYRHHGLDLEEVRVRLEDDSAYGRFLQGLFLPSGAPPLLQPGELEEERLTLLPAATPVLEAQAVARAVRDLIDGGSPPGAIVLVAQRPAGRALLRAALARYGVPIFGPVPLSEPDLSLTLLQTPPLQAVLAIYALFAQGVPREPFIQLLHTPYLRLGRGGAPPWRVARALREAGVRDLCPLAPAEVGEEPDYKRRLREWARERSFDSKSTRSTTTMPTDAAGSHSVLATVEGALAQLGTLPEEATLLTHIVALRRLCERLLLAGCGASAALAPAGRALDDSAAVGRDQEAVAGFYQVLDDLQGAASRLGEPRARLSRGQFAQLLGTALLQPLRPRGAPGAAVVLTDLLGAVGRCSAHLFITGLLEGQLPERGGDDPLLPDDERRALNRLLEKDVFPPCQSQELLCPLWFLGALVGAKAAHLSWPRADEAGRPLLRSPFVDAVLRAAARAEPAPIGARVVPTPALARCPQELWMSAALDRYGAPGWRSTSERPSRRRAGAALLAALAAKDAPRAQGLAALVEIEADRLRFFSARLKQGPGAHAADRAGPFVGRLLDPALRQQLTDRLPGSPGHPLSASALEDYAKCPFRFFVRRVLRAEPIREGGDDLDALAGGRLHHEALERFFKERLSSGRLPLRGDGDDRAALDTAIDAVGAKWPERERMGHRELFSVRVRRLREDLWRLVEREAAQPIEEGLVPKLFEHKFGPLAISSASEADGGLPLHIYGIIDRVDVGPGRALVLDYKTGRLDRYEQILRHDLLDTSFQLPLYAAALKADAKEVLAEESTLVTARYYSLRSGRATTGELTDQQMISLEPQVAAQAKDRNVAEVSYRLWRKLRDGDFRVDPRSCEGCGLEAACRVSLVVRQEEEVDAYGSGKER